MEKYDGSDIWFPLDNVTLPDVEAFFKGTKGEGFIKFFKENPRSKGWYARCTLGKYKELVGKFGYNGNGFLYNSLDLDLIKIPSIRKEQKVETMNKYDGSNIYFSTSGLNLNDVKDFFKGKVSDYIFERIVSYFNANKHQVVFIRVCPALPKKTDLMNSPVEFVHDNDEEFYSQRLKKVEIPTMNVADKISSLEKRIKELEEQLESTKPVKIETIKQWAPKKEKHYVNLHLNKVFSINHSNSFGDIIPELTYPTLDLAINAKNALLLHAKLLAYHAEFCPDYKPDWKNVNPRKYYIIFDNSEGVYKVDWKYVSNSLSEVYFPEDIARFLVDKLNSGEVVL